MVSHPLEPERSPSSQGSSDGRRSSGQLSFRRRSGRFGRASRDGGSTDIDEWGKNQSQRTAAVEALRNSLRELPEFDYIQEYDPHTLLRFLRARDYDHAKAVEMYTNHLRWRKENNVDTILTDFDFTEREAFLGVYPQGYYKTDRMGRPITIQHLGSIDLKKIKEVTSMERMILFHIQEYERFLKHITPVCSRVAGHHVDQTFAILDVKGVSLKMLTGDVRKMLGDLTKIDSDHYPETLGKTLIINVPLFFKAVWACVKPMLAARTVDKITLVGTRYMDELLKHIDIENIPEYLGGKSRNALIDDAGPWNDPTVLSSLNKIAENTYDEVREKDDGVTRDKDRPDATTIGTAATPSSEETRYATTTSPHLPPSPVRTAQTFDIAANRPSYSPRMLPPPAPPPAVGMPQTPLGAVQRPNVNQQQTNFTLQRSTAPVPSALSSAPSRDTSFTRTEPMPGSPHAPVVERVRELERILRERGGVNLANVPPPASNTLLARVEFLEQSMELVLQAQMSMSESMMETSQSDARLQEAERELEALRAQRSKPPEEPRAHSGCCCVM